jgi:hypothetical protein
MLILLQNKLIYLPYIPFGARKETIEAYKPQLLGFGWATSDIRTRDGKKLTACVEEIRLDPAGDNSTNAHSKSELNTKTILVYFQG